MGFTAINSSSPPRPDETRQNSGSTGSDGVSPSDQHGTVVSAYLGRGKQDDSAPAGKPATKKATGKGKKRATTTPDPSNVKKRRMSTISDAMPATKARATSKKEQNAQAETGDRAGRAALQHEPAPTFKKIPKHERIDEAASNPAPPSVSIVAPSTSISSLSNVSQRTSYDAVKISSGRGVMLYNTSSSLTAAKTFDHVQFSQPPLDLPQSSIKAHQPASETDDDLFEGDDDGFGALFDELAEQIGSKKAQDPTTDNAGRHGAAESTSRKQSKRSTAITTSSRDGSEEFIADDDDDFAEAMVVAGETTRTSVSNKKLRSASKLQQPLTPPASETNDTFAIHGNLQPTADAPGKHDEAITIDSDEDEDLIELDKAMKAAEKAGFQPRHRKQNMHDVSQDEDYGGALLDEAEKQLLKQLKSATLSTDIKPIARTAFPDPVLDRSPLFGATNTTVLRACFRLGEALNVGSHAVRNNKNVLLEIYARVTSSFRRERKQHLVFKDLYHDKPPHLEGDFELWSQSRLWDLDGKAFLGVGGAGVMCRAIARMKRDGTKWRLEVLSIWEAGWDDVEAVAGIFSKDTGGCINHD